MREVNGATKVNKVAHLSTCGQVDAVKFTDGAALMANEDKLHEFLFLLRFQRDLDKVCATAVGCAHSVVQGV
jgi:hypothetical protein